MGTSCLLVMRAHVGLDGDSVHRVSDLEMLSLLRATYKTTPTVMGTIGQDTACELDSDGCGQDPEVTLDPNVLNCIDSLSPGMGLELGSTLSPVDQDRQRRALSTLSNLVLA